MPEMHSIRCRQTVPACQVSVHLVPGNGVVIYGEQTSGNSDADKQPIVSASGTERAKQQNEKLQG